MKNVYSMQAFGVSNEEFRLDVWHNDPSTGVDLATFQEIHLMGHC